MRNNIKIHFIYIIGILLAIIVTLLTVNWSGKDDLVKQISFAASISSIILAALAIIYAFFSSSSLTNTIGLFTNASNDLDKNAQIISEISSELSAKVGEIPEQIAGMRERVEALPSEIKEITKFATAHPGDIGETIKRDDLIDALFKISSLRGLEALFIVTMANDTNYAFILEDVDKGIKGGGSAEYYYGFITAIASIGLIAFTIKNNLLNITQVNDKIKGQIREVAFSRAKRLNEENADSLIDVDFSESLTLIESYFSEQ